jgi:hypothetical protein
MKNSLTAFVWVLPEEIVNIDSIVEGAVDICSLSSIPLVLDITYENNPCFVKKAAKHKTHFMITDICCEAIDKLNYAALIITTRENFDSLKAHSREGITLIPMDFSAGMSLDMKILKSIVTQNLPQKLEPPQGLLAQVYNTISPAIFGSSNSSTAIPIPPSSAQVEIAGLRFLDIDTDDLDKSR